MASVNLANSGIVCMRSLWITGKSRKWGCSPSTSSGHPGDTPILTVAGFVATVEKWIHIEKRWKKVLDNYGVSELHMKHFSHSAKQFAPRKGSYIHNSPRLMLAPVWGNNIRDASVASGVG